MDMVWDTVGLDTDMVVLDMDILIMVKLYLPSFQSKSSKLSLTGNVIFSALV